MKPELAACDAIVLTDERAEPGYWTARQHRGDEVLLSEAEIRRLNHRMGERSRSLTELSGFPAVVRRDELREWIFSAQQDFRDLSEIQEFYDASGAPVTYEDYRAAQENCNPDALSETVTVRYGVTVQRGNLRLLPGDKNYFDSASFRHYDQLQGTALDPGEPLLVLHESRDGAFAFVRSRHYMGWLPVKDMVPAVREEWERYIHPSEFLVITADKKRIVLDDGEVRLFQMGSILPLASPTKAADGTWLVSVPTAHHGRLREIAVSLSEDDTVHRGWLPCTKNNFIRQAFRFLGEPYGWGGMEDSVDCSSLVGDVYRSMGLEIPRDADEQELAMPEIVRLEWIPREKRRALLRTMPAGALLFKPGHVMMYLGEDDAGIPCMIHALSSYFAFRGDVPEKHFIRKVSVSDLRYLTRDRTEMLDSLTSIGFLKE